VSIDVPPGGTATQGAAQGVGLSRGAADPHGPGTADPGGDTALTGEAPSSDLPGHGGAAQSGLGATVSGGRLEDFDAVLKQRNPERS
jgi:hypothetical protein